MRTKSGTSPQNGQDTICAHAGANDHAHYGSPVRSTLLVTVTVSFAAALKQRACSQPVRACASYAAPNDRSRRSTGPILSDHPGANIRTFVPSNRTALEIAHAASHRLNRLDLRLRRRVTGTLGNSNTDRVLAM